mmetsp:Transcript_698/g.1125  ORF Transcript_698/g.1125 Transcript_698/m.1125 type:complete len:201 (+) Transcript_698:146-748(+)
MLSDHAMTWSLSTIRSSPGPRSYLWMDPQEENATTPSPAARRQKRPCPEKMPLRRNWLPNCACEVISTALLAARKAPFLINSGPLAEDAPAAPAACSVWMAMSPVDLGASKTSAIGAAAPLPWLDSVSVPAAVAVAGVVQTSSCKKRLSPVMSFRAAAPMRPPGILDLIATLDDRVTIASDSAWMISPALRVTFSAAKAP